MKWNPSGERGRQPVNNAYYNLSNLFMSKIEKFNREILNELIRRDVECIDTRKSSCFWFGKCSKECCYNMRHCLFEHVRIVYAQTMHIHSYSFAAFFVFLEQSNLNNLSQTREMMSTTKTSYLHKKHLHTGSRAWSNKGKFCGNWILYVSARFVWSCMPYEPTQIHTMWITFKMQTPVVCKIQNEVCF